MRNLFLIFLFCYVTGKAQDRACVVSEKDSIPLSNVYICLKDRRVIAISDEKGVFSLEKYDSLSLNDTLYFLILIICTRNCLMVILLKIDVPFF